MTSDPHTVRTLIYALPEEIELADDSARLTLQLHAGGPEYVFYGAMLHRHSRVTLGHGVFTGLSVSVRDDGKVSVNGAYDESRQRPAISPDLTELHEVVRRLWNEARFDALRTDMLRVRAALG